MARVDLVERNDLLAAQNEELRGLLQQYVDGERGSAGGSGVGGSVGVGAGIGAGMGEFN